MKHEEMRDNQKLSMASLPGNILQEMNNIS